ncbi:neural proliferation differentiation and control protein 1 [Xenopus laevis]|uniref:Neural proliferation differentiation and control protein 1 n=2 Tax=Xenopus laevis TaxID=8355 RepID=A0A8J1LJG1_XENLA|nr:neural proliferation differentiation and control protein 1 [Xenopus laevis]
MTVPSLSVWACPCLPRSSCARPSLSVPVRGSSSSSSDRALLSQCQTCCSVSPYQPEGMGAPRVAGALIEALLGPILCCSLLMCLVALGAPADPCPRNLDCAIQRRENCVPGSGICGPCLNDFTEGTDGKCRLISRSAGRNLDTAVDREIDYIASVLANQEARPLNLAEYVNTTQSQSQVPPNVPPSAPSERSGGGVGSTVLPRRGSNKPMSDALVLGVVVGCAIAGLLAVVVAGICWCRMHNEMKLAEKVDYTAYKSSPPPPYEKTSPGDKKLAQSAQMYHYQHQKQQMLSMEKTKDEPKHPDSALTSEDETEDGDFTVYECPGLAPTGEMEVKNPLFDDSNLHHPTHNTP